MEYVEGSDLLEFLKQGKKPEERNCAKMLSEILQALSYIHSTGFCHRDIKLSNILIGKNQKIKIIDFGLSQKYQSPNKLKTSCGSPCFAAPELISELPYDPVKADIWSVGVVLYSMLSLSLPFYHYDVKKLYRLVQRGRYNVPKNISE